MKYDEKITFKKTRNTSAIVIGVLVTFLDVFIIVFALMIAFNSGLHGMDKVLTTAATTAMAGIACVIVDTLILAVYTTR